MASTNGRSTVRKSSYSVLATPDRAWPSGAMAKGRNRPASRKQPAPRWFRWTLCAFAGVIGGLFLGDLVAGWHLVRPDSASQGYARFSANPDAMTGDAAPAPDCFDCNGHYGAATRLRSAHEARADASFRELGAVEIDTRYSEPADDYHYGGGFPDARGRSESEPYPATGLQPRPPLENPAPENPADKDQPLPPGN